MMVLVFSIKSDGKEEHLSSFLFMNMLTKGEWLGTEMSRKVTDV